MTKFFVRSSHAECLADGRTFAPGDEIELGQKEQQEDHNQRLISDGILEPAQTALPNREEGDS